MEIQYKLRRRRICLVCEILGNITDMCCKLKSCSAMLSPGCIHSIHHWPKSSPRVGISSPSDKQTRGMYSAFLGLTCLFYLTFFFCPLDFLLHFCLLFCSVWQMFSKTERRDFDGIAMFHLASRSGSATVLTIWSMILVFSPSKF